MRLNNITIPIFKFLTNQYVTDLMSIIFLRYENGIWTKPQVAFFSTLVAGGIDDAPFIAPDGSYLIYSRRELSKPIKLFICFRKSDGKWTKPRDLSNIIGLDGINTDILQGDCPLVTIDGKYLFFRDDLNGSLRPFWMEAGFIEELQKLS